MVAIAAKDTAPDTRFDRWRRRVPPALPALLVVVALTLRRAWLIGPLPPGLDGGQWLAYGRGLLGGEGRSTPGAYAPLGPALVAALAEAVGPVDAVRLMALGSYAMLLLVLAGLVVPAVGPAAAAAAVAGVGLAGTVNEPLAFGGYPQQVAIAGLLAAAVGLSRFGTGSGGARAAWLAATGAAIAALAHHLYALVALVALSGVALLALATPAGRGRVRPTLALLAALLLLVGGLAAPTWIAFAGAGYEPPLDAVTLSVPDAWRYGTREAPAVWLAAALLAAVALLLPAIRNAPPLGPAAGALLLVGVAGFVVTAEPRLLPLVLIGAVLALAVAGRGLARWFGRSALAPLPVALLALALVVPGDRVTREYLAFYRVLDPSLLAAAAAIERASADCGLEGSAWGIGCPPAVAVRADRRGWPIGWWIEGLTETPVLVGSDRRWLGFPRERERAAVVAALFDGGLSPDDLRRQAAAAGVRLLLVRKWEWIGWERWLDAPEPAVAVAFDDGESLLLRLRPAARGTPEAGV